LKTHFSLLKSSQFLSGSLPNSYSKYFDNSTIVLKTATKFYFNILKKTMFYTTTEDWVYSKIYYILSK